jgi:hypothetical protein
MASAFRRHALRAVAVAYRDYGRAHPGRYAGTMRAPRPGDAAHTAAAEAVLRVVFAVLAGYGITGDDAIDAARAHRAALHGFLTLEARGGFGLSRDIDHFYQGFITAFDTAPGTWAAQPDPTAGDPGTPEAAAASGVLTWLSKPRTALARTRSWTGSHDSVQAGIRAVGSEACNSVPR